MKFKFKRGRKPEAFTWAEVSKQNTELLRRMQEHYGPTAEFQLEYCKLRRTLTFTTPLKTRPVFSVDEKLNLKLISFAENLPLTLDDIKGQTP